MDTRRRLTAVACAPTLALALQACASSPSSSPAAPPEPPTEPAVAETALDPVPAPEPIAVAPAPAPLAEPAPAAPAPVSRRAPQDGRRAIAAANAEARVASSADAFVGGVQMFAWAPGRVYEIWTAPLRVTTLTLAPGETVISKAAGDTVRWQIGESTSGEGASARTHVLIKPIQTGLETNLVLTTNRRVYMLQLRSGAADAFNAAIAWDLGVPDEPEPPQPAERAASPSDLAGPEGPVDARYRISPRGRAPRWSPRSVFDDGARTFILLSASATTTETPALFVLAAGEPELVNYRQSGDMIVVDRLFDEAELRVGGRRPQIVRLTRLGDRR